MPQPMMTSQDTQLLARTWLMRNGTQLDRELALLHCTAHLVDTHGIRGERAATATMQAIAEIESANQRAYVDLNVSTAQLVVVRRQGQAPLAFTLSDLVRLHREHCTKAQTSPASIFRIH